MGDRADRCRLAIDAHGRFLAAPVPSDELIHGLIECVANVRGNCGGGGVVSHGDVLWGRRPIEHRVAPWETIISFDRAGPNSGPGHLCRNGLRPSSITATR